VRHIGLIEIHEPVPKPFTVRGCVRITYVFTLLAYGTVGGHKGWILRRGRTWGLCGTMRPRGSPRTIVRGTHRFKQNTLVVLVQHPILTHKSNLRKIHVSADHRTQRLQVVSRGIHICNRTRLPQINNPPLRINVFIPNVTITHLHGVRHVILV